MAVLGRAAIPQKTIWMILPTPENSIAFQAVLVSQGIETLVHNESQCDDTKQSNHGKDKLRKHCMCFDDGPCCMKVCITIAMTCLRLAHPWLFKVTSGPVIFKQHLGASQFFLSSRIQIKHPSVFHLNRPFPTIIFQHGIFGTFVGVVHFGLFSPSAD